MVQYETSQASPECAIKTNPQPDSILRLRAVMARTGLSRSSIYRAMRAGSFPQPYYLPPSNYSIGWSEREIDAFLRQLRPVTARFGLPQEAE